MTNQDNETIYPAFQYPQELSGCDQKQQFAMLPEHEEITLRPSPAGSRDSHAVESEGQTRNLYESTARAVDGDFRASPECEPHEVVAEIDLDSLSPADQILIETLHSVYHFTVIDPMILSGRLIGGVMGNRLVYAVLIPSMLKSNSSGLASES